MYSYKAKIKHLRDLFAPTHVQTDLEYLKKVDPRNDQLPSFEHAPERNAERILYNLLDLVTADDIRNNRRRVTLEKEAAEKVVQEDTKRLVKEKKEAEKAAKEKADRLAAEKEAAEKSAREEAERLAEEKRIEDEKLRVAALEALQAGAPTELEKQKSELKEQLEDMEFERDEAIGEKEELEEKLADTETSLEKVEAELEKEKKSEVKPTTKPVKQVNSKKTTNTRTSSGKNSQTKTFK